MSSSPTIDVLPGEVEPPSDRDPRALLALFRERLLTGNYNYLIGDGLRRTLRGAATDTSLQAEIGALRLTLVRLLNEESDPSRLAAGVARVAGVAVQAARLRESSAAELDQLRAVLLREVDAIEREYAEREARAQHHEPVEQDKKEALRHDEI